MREGLEKRNYSKPAALSTPLCFDRFLKKQMQSLWKKNARPLTPNSFSARGTGQCARRNGFTKGRRPGKINSSSSATFDHQLHENCD